MLLYKKKKYAAVKVNSDGTELKEIKGLDMVRRDWCELSKSICYDCLNILLDTKNREDIPGKLLELLEERYQQI